MSFMEELDTGGQLFGRVYRLEIGDEGETLTIDGFGPDRLSKEIYAVGGSSMAPAQIRFRVANTISSNYAVAEITVYGLGYASRMKAYTRYDKVRLYAGYRSRHGLIFAGTIYNVGIGKEGPDNYITLLCTTTGREFDSAFLNRAFGVGTPQKEIIQAAADSMGLPVEFVGDFDALPRTIGGRTTSMPPKLLLTQMAYTYGFTWHVEDGRIIAAINGATRNIEHRFSAETGMVGSPVIHERGLDVRVLMAPNVRPLDEVVIENATGDLAFASRVVRYQGTIGIGRYDAHAVIHTGDYHGDNWATTIVCFRPRTPERQGGAG